MISGNYIPHEYRNALGGYLARALGIWAVNAPLKSLRRPVKVTNNGGPLNGQSLAEISQDIQAERIARAKAEIVARVPSERRTRALKVARAEIRAGSPVHVAVERAIRAAWRSY